MTSKLNRIGPFNNSVLIGHGQDPMEVMYGKKTRLDQSFTKTIARHGFYHDTSLDAATRSKKRHMVNLQRKKSTMDRLSANFEAEARKVALLQRKLAKYQHDMAFTAQQKFAVLYLQSIFRGCLARRLLLRLFYGRFLREFLSFRYRYRMMLCAATVLIRATRAFLATRRYQRFVYHSRNARTIQKAYRKRYRRMRAVVRMGCIKLCRDVICMGIAKAKQQLCVFERARRVLYKFMHGYIRKQRQKRLGNSSGARKIFYALFHIDKLPPMLPADTSVPSKSSFSRRGTIVSSVDDSYRIDCALKRIEHSKFEESVEQLRAFVKAQAAREARRIKKEAHEIKRFRRGNSRVTPAPPTKVLKKLSSAPPNLSSSTSNLGDQFPKKVLKRRASSQLEPELIFANEKTKGSKQSTPYVLRDSFRLKSLHEVVDFLVDLSRTVAKSPELIQSDLALLGNESSDEDSRVSKQKNSVIGTLSRVTSAETIFPFGEVRPPPQPPKKGRRKFLPRGSIIDNSKQKNSENKAPSPRNNVNKPVNPNRRKSTLPSKSEINLHEVVVDSLNTKLGDAESKTVTESTQNESVVKDISDTSGSGAQNDCPIKNDSSHAVGSGNTGSNLAEGMDTEKSSNTRNVNGIGDTPESSHDGCNSVTDVNAASIPRPSIIAMNRQNSDPLISSSSSDEYDYDFDDFEDDDASSSKPTSSRQPSRPIDPKPSSSHRRSINVSSLI
mmetsp:Transcript_2988/g.4532  ORF Transcript_2988/g.4532 Transcript_2988/m.4532 type:complete len:724 (-) Transcript_2988:165-2336(-)|eukprot:CAMPEP_0185032950 /NCGR_PEP_ID=MMETSP1103-20130426/21507_1 /TAXON_ID=36769 /ORGANISM="Paraphysomonas bandaiensis, Strain Caron Lab Isolate" /LENGTH=723 /DNA_ID=CAMNT_0027569051 /DNA_START=78 /DNA_END=2249 /DNA_ORIENTATION=+